jgi:oxalate decarboxylase
MSQQKPAYENSGGNIRIAASTNFPASKTVAAALVTVKQGSMRELHWHPDADEWQYYMQGSARMTVFNTGPHANTTDFRAGDVGLVRRNCGHYLENIGDDDLVLSRRSAATTRKRSRWPTGSATCRPSSCPRT